MNTRALTIAAFAGAGVAGAALGLTASFASSKSAYLHDVTADPNQVIATTGDYNIERARPDLGPLVGYGVPILGIATAIGGSAWLTFAATHSGNISKLQRFGAAGVIGAGIGLAAGATAASMLYKDAQITRR